MTNIFKLYTFIILQFLCFLDADSSEFKNIYRDDFCFINDSDKVFSIDARPLKNARLFRTAYESEIIEPILVHPGRYTCTCLRYVSDDLELGHILLYGTDLIQHEAAMNIR